MERETGEFRDLEWMLKSGLASVPVLAEALLDQYGAALRGLAFAILLDRPAAREALEEGLARAIQRAVGEWNGLDLEGWVSANVVQSAARSLRKQQPFSRTFSSQLLKDADSPATPAEMEFWVMVASLNPGERLALILVKGLEIPAPAVAQWLKGTLPGVQGQANQALERLFWQLDQDGFDFSAVVGDAAYPLGPATAALALRTLLARRAAQGVASPVETREAAARIAARIQRRDRTDSKNRFLRDLLLGAAAFGLVLFGLRLANQLLPRPSVPPLPRPTPAVIQITATPRVLLPMPAPFEELHPLKPLLGSASTTQEILQRMVESRKLWSTLWADAQIVYYGPPGYIGPPQVYRNQVWLRQLGRQSLFLTGDYSGSPDSVFISYVGMQIGRDFSSKPGGLDLIETDGKTFPMIHLADLDLDSNQLLRGYYLGDLIFPDRDSFWKGILIPVGEESVAGRSAILAEWYPPNGQGFISLSIDAQTGLILHWRQFHPQQGDLISFDILITRLKLDPLIPRDVFNIEQYRQEKLEWGNIWVPQAQANQRLRYLPITDVQRESLTPIPPPAGFDPSLYRLTFDWLADPLKPERAGSQVNLYAAIYSLGQVNVGSPWGLACTRSPDGSLVALMSPNDHSDSAPGTPFYWLRLAFPALVHKEYAREMFNGDLAFSPDGKSLAYTGCPKEGDCAVTLLDTTTGESRRLFPMAEAGYFAWSPNGRLLAFTGRRTASQEQMTLFVVDAARGGLLYLAPFQPNHPDLNRDAPVNSWGISYPPQPGGIAACTRAPAR
ncbi:MAG TPA: hypothetical protein VMT46_07920 [Anaerolineaceae bacterium]|nr:hypothetical protein [Anaerolineaceae bacterium]